MDELNEEIHIDCGNLSARRPVSKPKPPSARPPAARRAPVALGQRPTPQPDRWDPCDARIAEYGSVDELRDQLIAKLEEALARVRGDWRPTKWDVPTRTWPYTRIGLLLLRCISLAEVIADRVNKTE